jgi:hypothetical protein
MINQGNDVPNKTIAVFSDPSATVLETNSKEKFTKIINKSPKKRDWFTPHFYKCLPLTIGNQYGFILKTEYDFSFIWDGGSSPSSLTFDVYEDVEQLKNKYPGMSSHFGEGIITLTPPFILRTPPGINLMTINPPNYVIPNITVMTGVIETDNLRRSFTFNLKVQIPNMKVFVPAGSPLVAFIPIPRNFADSFELKNAEDIFSQEIIDEETQAAIDFEIHRREVEPKLKNKIGRFYMKGEDIYGNEFPDHQGP